MNADDEAGRHLLCQCLASVAMADGELDGREIATMVTVVEQVTGSLLSADDLVGAAIELEEDPERLEESLRQHAAAMDATFKSQILKTCILVGRADTFILDRERDSIEALGRKLGFSPEEVEAQFKVVR